MFMYDPDLDYYPNENVLTIEPENNDELSVIAKSHRDLDMVYKAQGGHFDRENVLAIEGKSSGDLPKTVLIKRVVNQKYEKITKTSKEFFAEIKMLEGCKHPNLLSLIGFCDEESEMILVFECAFKESLDDYLGSTSTKANLSLKQQLRLCLDIAKGLKYLHDMKDKSSRIHQGILSANIMLDENWTAKIANFRVSNFNSYPASLWQSGLENSRTWLWDAMDAPWIPSGQRLVVDDTYSLGVILFEIQTGRLAYDNFYIAKNVNGLASMARQHYDEDRLKNMPDQDSFYTFSEIAYQCLAETQSEGPTLEAVIRSLERLHFQVSKSLF
ncbi:putative protein kinase RLK-Pelle-CrRLK1L-1 family [Helianthus debilis subsp. tardiflorus]